VLRRQLIRYAFTVVGCFHKRDAPWTPRGWRTLQRESREPSSKMEKLLRRVPDPVVYVAGAVAAVFAALKVKKIANGGSFADEQAAYRRCNRCGKKGAPVRCNKCRRAYYCSKHCLKDAVKLEICECC